MAVTMATLDLDRATLARWRSNPTAFIEEVLHDPATKRPFVLLPAERLFLEYAFKRDANGRLLFPEQVFAAPKKSGKTTLAAIHTLATVLLFGGAYPEAVCCANDLEQSRSRVFEIMRRIIECSPILAAEARCHDRRIVFPALNIVITPLAADYASAAGGNQCASVFDELWAYTTERSQRLFDELVPVPTRQISLRLTCTYAGFSGESALLERLYRRGLEQPQVGPDLYAGDGILMFWSHQPIAPWQDERWLAEMRRTLRPNAYLRMIENRFVTSESGFVEMGAWDACTDPAAHPQIADRSLQIYIGIDASVKHDSTAIVCCAWDRVLRQVRLVWHRTFQPSPDEPLNFKATVEATVLDLHKRFQVCKVLFDPYQMAASAQRLQSEGVKIEEFPQTTSNLTAASQNLYELIHGRNLIVYPDASMRLAIQRAVAIEIARGWRIAKDRQTARIDVVVALAQAALAAVRSQCESNYDRSGAWIDGGDGDVPEAVRHARWRAQIYWSRYPISSW